MTSNSDRILTTHVGSLPRPDDLIDLLYTREQGEPYDETVMAERVRTAVADVVARQRAVGLDIVNDGESSKVAYSTYGQDRLTGFTGNHIEPWDMAELAPFPRLAARFAEEEKEQKARFAVCEGPISYRGHDALTADLENLSQAANGEVAAGTARDDIFITAASPGVIGLVLSNRYYETNDEFIWAIAEAMKTEYDAIHQAGFILQLDCPDIPCGSRDGQHYTLGIDRYRAGVEQRIAALNHATRDIPPERMRMHICWGTTRDPISSISRCRRSSISSWQRVRPVSRSRPPILATRTSGVSGKTWRSPPASTSFLASSTPPPTTSSTRSWWPNV